VPLGPLASHAGSLPLDWRSVRTIVP
jgi:hypothetical protein